MNPAAVAPSAPEDPEPEEPEDAPEVEPSDNSTPNMDEPVEPPQSEPAPTPVVEAVQPIAAPAAAPQQDSTSENKPPPSGLDTVTAAIIGAVAGALLLMLIAIGVFCGVRRYRSKQEDKLLRARKAAVSRIDGKPARPQPKSKPMPKRKKMVRLV